MCTHRDCFWFVCSKVAANDSGVESGEHNTMHSRQLEAVLEKIKKIKVPYDAEIHSEIVFSNNICL